MSIPGTASNEPTLPEQPAWTAAKANLYESGASVDPGSSSAARIGRLRFIAPLPPSTNNAYASVSGNRVKTKVAREFTERVGDIVVAAKAVAGSVPTPPFSLRLDVWFPDQGRRDLSNTIKLLEDSLMRAIGQDDRHVHLLVVRRCGVDRWNARVEVVLEHIEPLAGADDREPV